eukprot:TRINITY_DN117_c1_g1_i1.p1 TRINITY_DN117_c1_g1~~TRINITY_DN117_c1_g1_i1.p1  ORF type:complete len:692 (-),score=224.73 TRINITY_DN117_c1_g1_i1:125-2155(-)
MATTQNAMLASLQAKIPQLTSVPSLSTCSISFNLVREIMRKEFFDALDKLKGEKTLVLDTKLTSIISVLVEYQKLQDFAKQIIRLAPSPPMPKVNCVVFILRPKVSNLQLAIQIINSWDPKHKYMFLFVPRRTIICERVLEEEGFKIASSSNPLGGRNILVDDCPIDITAFDDDVLSLELELGFKECYLEGDKTSIFQLAQALMKIQQLLGIIPIIKGKGECAKNLFDLLKRMRREVNDSYFAPTSQIESLFLIDRAVDMITPMCTQFTFEGLIDEVFGITTSCVSLPAEMIHDMSLPENQKKFKEGQMIKKVLNSNDPVFAELRFYHISAIGPALNRKAKEIDQFYKRRHEAKTVKELNEFVKQLPNIQLEHTQLRALINIAEQIQQQIRDTNFHKRISNEQALLSGQDSEDIFDYIMNCIFQEQPFLKLLRIIILFSLVNNGINTKQFDIIRNEVVQTYGYDKLVILNTLQRLQLLKRQDAKPYYEFIKKALRLNIEERDMFSPADIGYVHTVYAPISIRIMQQAFAPGGLQSIEELKLLPGPAFEETQSLSEEAEEGLKQKVPVTLVVFIGGCTYSEIAAVRWLQRLEERRKFVIVTTKLINGDSFLNSLSELPLQPVPQVAINQPNQSSNQPQTQPQPQPQLAQPLAKISVTPTGKSQSQPRGAPTGFRQRQ